MPIIALQRQQTEAGRIRLGHKVTASNGKSRPAKLETLRFTSPRRSLIDAIAAEYGGEVRQWTPDRGASQWEVISDATEVPVMIPPQDPTENQWYEDWTAGGCVRRCDGQRERLSNKPCMCDPDPKHRKCKLHTRLRVMLADIPGLGAWRIDTSSYYAALELPGVAELLQMAGGIIAGRLILDPRTRVAEGKTKQFMVPKLDIDDFTPRQLVGGQVPALAAQRRAEALEAAPAPGTAVAIAGGSPWERLIEMAPTDAALYKLHDQIKAAEGEVSEDLLELLKSRKAALRQASVPAVDVEPEDEPPVDDLDVIDGEVVPANTAPGYAGEVEWPKAAKPGSGGTR